MSSLDPTLRLLEVDSAYTVNNWLTDGYLVENLLLL